MLFPGPVSAEVVGPVEYCQGHLFFLGGEDDKQHVVAQFTGGISATPTSYVQVGKDGYGPRKPGVVFVIWGSDPTCLKRADRAALQAKEMAGFHLQSLSRYEGVTEIICYPRDKKGRYLKNKPPEGWRSP
jgi:hypothetical protein